MNFPSPDPGMVNCRGCQRVNIPGCPRCKQCSEICGCACRTCRNCTSKEDWSIGKRVYHSKKVMCRLCGRCRRENFRGDPTWQCQCRGKKFKDARQFTGTFNQNELPRALGLEIELSSIGAYRQSTPGLPSHKVTHDGSVNGDGVELVIDPLIGDNFISSILSLGQYLLTSKCGVDESCGFHVHVGADGKSWGPFEHRRLIQLYANVQKDIYALVAPGRAERTFRDHLICGPFKMRPSWYKGLWAENSPRGLRKYILQWLYGARLLKGRKIEGRTVYASGRMTPEEVQNWEWLNAPEIKAHKYETARYMGLNLHSWMMRETIEWRHHEGTLDLERLVYWPLLCGWITELASSLKDDEVKEIGSLRQLMVGEWKRPFKYIVVPENVREWTLRELGKRGL